MFFNIPHSGSKLQPSRLHRFSAPVLLHPSFSKACQLPWLSPYSAFGNLQLRELIRYLLFLEQQRLRNNKKPHAAYTAWRKEMRQRSIFPGRHQPSIFDVLELNFCVRNGNRWNLQAIATAKGELIWFWKKLFSPSSDAFPCTLTTAYELRDRFAISFWSYRIN